MNHAPAGIPHGDFTGWYALPELVGREEFIARAIAALTREGKRVVFVLGEGGIGKTRVLQTIIERLKQNPGAGAINLVNQEVDLYHTEVHTTNGLADALYQASPFLHDDALARMYEQLVQQWVTGVGYGSARLRQDHLNSFATLLATACQQRPTVLALDTAERLMYGRPSLPAYLRRQVAGAWEWLLDLLVRNPNLRLLIAGRPEAGPLCDDLARRLGSDHVARLELEPLSEEEGLAYFDAVATLAREHDDTDLQRALEALDEDRRRQAVRWAGGVPIRLALMIDYLSLGFALPDDPGQAGSWDAHFFERLQTSPYWDLIEALGRLPKGADVELLARLLGSQEEAQKQALQTQLETIRKFTFVKVRPVPGLGERYFLHDEMYRLLQQAVFKRPGDAARAGPVYETIVSYYEEREKEWRREMEALFQPVEDGKTKEVDKAQLSKLYRRQIALHTADVYYSLHQDPNNGFRRRYRYTRDAELSGNVALDYALQAELLVFIGEQNGEALAADADWEGALMMRPVVRAWVEEEYERALEEASRLRREAQEALRDKLNAAILNTWEAYALIYLSRDLDKAETMLGEAIDLAQTHCEDANSLRAWRAKAILAFAHRVRGYLYDGQERLDEAHQDYRRAAPLWREINLQIESATTLKDYAYSLGLKGEFEQAQRFVQDAMEIYRRLASIGNVGLALNALALIRMMDGDYQEAIESSRRALRLGQAIGNRRLQGLAAVALAEAMRRSVGPGTLPALSEKIRVLEEALAYAQQALEQFEHTGEQIYLIQSLIEKGCNRRNLVHICVEHPELDYPQEKVDHYIQESADDLREAAQKAQAIGHTGLQLDALVNLGWLGYFARDDELVAEATQAVRQTAAALYPHPAAEHPQVTATNRHLASQWEQMAKHYTMRGGQAFRVFKEAREKGHLGEEGLREKLKEAGRFWTYSIFFNAQKGENFDNFRRAKDFIYQRLRSLNEKELGYVISGVEEVEKEIGQNKSGMRTFMEASFLWPPSP